MLVLQSAVKLVQFPGLGVLGLAGVELLSQGGQLVVQLFPAVAQLLGLEG